MPAPVNNVTTGVPVTSVPFLGRTLADSALQPSRLLDHRNNPATKQQWRRPVRWPLGLFTAPLPGAPGAAALPGLLRVGGRLWPTTWEMLPFSLSVYVTHRCGCPGRALRPSQQVARLDCSCITGQDAGGRQRHGHSAVGWWARGAHEQQTSAAASPGESGLQHVRSCSKNLPVLTQWSYLVATMARRSRPGWCGSMD